MVELSNYIEVLKYTSKVTKVKVAAQYLRFFQACSPYPLNDEL